MTPHNPDSRARENQIIKLAETFCQRTGAKETTVATYSAGQAYAFQRLRDGCSISSKRYDKIVRWFAAHWSDALYPGWPVDIPRPDISIDQPFPPRRRGKTMTQESNPGFAGTSSYVPVTGKTPRRSLFRRLLPRLSPEKRIALGTIWVLIKALFSQRQTDQIAAHANNLEEVKKLQQSLASQGSDQPTKH